MKSRYVHLRPTDWDKYIPQPIQNGGITIYGELQEDSDTWLISASACHSWDRFVRKEGNAIAYNRFIQGDTVEIPCCQETISLWAALMEYEGPISKHAGVNNMYATILHKMGCFA